MDISSIIVLIGFVGTCFLAAMAGAMFRPGDWYEQLRKPGLAPAELGVSPSLGISLSDHRCFRLAGMADFWFRWRRVSVRDLSRAIDTECFLVANFFWNAPARPGLR